MTNLPPQLNEYNNAEMTNSESTSSIGSEGRAPRKTKEQRRTRAGKKIGRINESLLETKDREEGEYDAKIALAVETEIAKRIAEDKNKVVHPWMLSQYNHHFLPDGRVVLLNKDGATGVYRVADKADNLDGIGVLRSERDQGSAPLPLTWSNHRYVQLACNPLVAEAFGKSDIDFRFLVPRAIVNLSKFVKPWPGAENDILSYLNSRAFSQLLVEFNSKRLELAPDVLMAKVLRVGSRFLASRAECEQAYQLYTNTMGGFSRATFGCFMVFMYLLLVWIIHSLFPIDIVLVADSLLTIGGLAFGYVWLSRPTKVVLILEALREEGVGVKYGAVIEVAPTCSKDLKLPPLLSKQWKYSLTRGNFDLPCADKKPYNSYGCLILGAPMVVPKACHHDQYNGLAIRYFFDRTYNKDFVAQFIENSKNVLSGLTQVAPFILKTEEEWLAHLAGRRRQLLLDEPDAADLKPTIPVDIFVKLEAYLGKDPYGFKPRIIQGRQLAYQKLVGSYFWSVSSWLAATFCPGNPTGFVYDSGLDAMQLGELALEVDRMVQKGDNDVSNWDGSMLPEFIKFEIWILENFIFKWCGKPEWWPRVKPHWCTMRGSGKHGVGFRTKHGRRSGDAWTAFMNSLFNILFCKFLEKHFGVKAKGVVRGDDNFFGCSKKIPKEAIETFYSWLGLKSKYVTRDGIDNLEYCSGKFYYTSDGWKWGVKPFRIIQKLGLNLHRHPTKIEKRLLYGTAISLLPIGGHVPFLGDLLRTICVDGAEKELDPIVEFNEYKTTSLEVHDIHPVALHYAQHQYGLSVDDVDAIRYAMVHNVKTHKLLTLDDFPIVFDDPRILNAYLVDVGAEPGLDTSNICVECNNPSTRVQFNRWWEFLLVVVFSPLWEELARWQWPFVFTVLTCTIEGLYLHPFNFCLHLMFLKLMHFHPGLAWAAHVCWNLAIWLSKVHYYDTLDRGRRYGALGLILDRNHSVTRLSRKGGVFTLMLDCVPFANNRLTNYVQTWLRKSCTCSQFKQSGNKTNKQQRKKVAGPLTPATLQKAKKALKKTNPTKSLRASPLLRTIVNPFTTNPGVKLPDNSAYPSVCLTVNTSVRLSVDPNGRAAIAIHPQGANHYFYPKVTGATYDQPYAWLTPAGAASASNWSSFANAFSAYRVVAGGVRVKCDGSFNNMTGRIYVVDVPLVTNAYANANDYMPTTLAQATYNDAVYEEYTMMELMSHGIQGIFRRTDSQSESFIQSLYPSSPNLATPAGDIFSTRGWASKILLFEGLPASANCIEIQTVLHIEGIGTPVNSLVPATPAVQPNPSAMATVYNVGQAAPVSHRIDEDPFAKISSAITKGTQIATQVIGAMETLAPLLGSLML